MISFAWPWLFVLLPLPFLMQRLKPVSNQQQSIRAPFFGQWHRLVAGNQQSLDTDDQSLLQRILLLCLWLCLVVASARPQILGEATDVPSTGRELLMAVDLSGSMDEQDLQLDNKPVMRLDVVKYLASDFLGRRHGDRVGLVVFGTKAYLYAPISRDLSTINRLLNETQIGLAGQKTAIGDAIGLSVKKLNEANPQEKVLILITDGANTSGTLLPEQAADLAKKSNVKIYTIGVGADEIITRGFFGLERRNPSLDLDEGSLQTIAETTGGQYFRAKKSEDLENIYDVIEQLEPANREDLVLRRADELYYWPSSLGIILLLVLQLIHLRGRLSWI